MRGFRFVAASGVAFLIASVVLIGQSKTAQPVASRTYPVTWSPELKLKSLADIPERLKQPFSQEEMDGLREVTEKGIGGLDAPVSRNCEELLQTADGQPAHADGFRTDEWGTLGVRCAALRALKTAIPAKRSFLHDLPWTVRLFSLLPVASKWGSDTLLDEELRAAQEKGLSIREFCPRGKFTAKSGELSQQDDDDDRSVPWWAGYAKIASGDFDGDGLEDIVMWATGGSGHSPRRRDYLYLLTRTRPGRNTKLTLLKRLY